MTADTGTTVTEQVNIAIDAINAAEAELQHWRDHLLRIQDEADDNLGIAHQARTSGQKVAGSVATARTATGLAVYSATFRLVS